LFALNVVRNKIAWTVDFQETAKRLVDGHTATTASGVCIRCLPVAAVNFCAYSPGCGPSFFDALYQHIIVFSIPEV
jgi:hypothetical protein